MTNNSFNGKDWPSIKWLESLGAKKRKRKHFKFSIGHAYLDIPNPEVVRIYKGI